MGLDGSGRSCRWQVGRPDRVPAESVTPGPTIAIRRIGGEVRGVPDQTGDELLALAIADPDRAALAATAWIADETDPLTLSFAHQALGIVLRDREDIDLALR